MAAFRLAFKMGAKAIEFDVHQTRDGELVVAHDDDLKRCGGDARRLKNLRWEEAGAVDVGSWFSPRFSGERLPRLGALFDWAPRSLELHLEIKHGSRVYNGIEERIVDFLSRRRGAWKRTVISSFDHRALRAIRELDPRARLGYLLGPTPLKAGLREMKSLSAESLHVSLRQAAPRTVAAAHGQGAQVLVYTVNAPEDRDRLAQRGVDGIFSNDPEIDRWR